MANLLLVLGIIIAFVGAIGPAWMFLFPRLNPDLWYRLGMKRTLMLVAGSLVVMLAWLFGDISTWWLVVIPILAVLRTFMRPYMVIRALEAPHLLSIPEADLSPDDYVLAVEVDGEARAWLREIVIAHHLIHDMVAGNPLLASW